MNAILYRVTIEVSPEAADEWLAWMRATHVPDVLRASGFLRAVICRTDAPTGPAAAVRFVVDYASADRPTVDAYLASDAAKRLRADHEARFGGRAKASREIFAEIAAISSARGG